MALINCVSCGKRMSNKAEGCPHCGFSPKNGVKSEDIMREKQKSIRRQLQWHSMAAVALFTCGGLLWYTGIAQADGWQGTLGRTVLAAGFILYVVTRVRLMLFNRKGVA